MEITNETENEVKVLANNLEPDYGNEKNGYAVSFSGVMDESWENRKPKNPMLISPVIRCVLKFLNIEVIKTCRLICREWGSIGKVFLANRALIHLHSYKYREVFRRPVDFYSCFLKSATLFSAFKISGDFTMKTVNDFWLSEELTNFFDDGQKYIKELTLLVGHSKGTMEKKIDLSSWIAKSPMLHNDTKYLTKLSIEGSTKFSDIPLSIIAHIKDLTLSYCRIKLETGIRICSTKLKLAGITFLHGGIKLDHVRINYIVDFSKAKRVLLHTWKSTKYIVDFKGRNALDILGLEDCEIVNGEISEWVIEQLMMINIPYSLQFSQMQIKQLYLYCANTVDLFTLPNSIQMLQLHNVGFGTTTICSQPILLENLQYLNVITGIGNDYSFLSHFKNCPQLTHLKLGAYNVQRMNSLWMPKSVKTLTFQGPSINWVDEKYLKLEKLDCSQHLLSIDEANKLCEAKIRVEDVYMQILPMYWYGEFVEFLEIRKRFNFGKRLYIGNVKWDEDKFDDRFLKDYVDEKSLYYVFENEEKGRALSEEAFCALIPKHPDIMAT